LGDDETLVFVKQLNCMPLVREQVIFTITRQNLADLVAVYSKLNNAQVLEMLEDFLREQKFEAPLEELQKSANGLLKQLMQAKHERTLSADLKINKLVSKLDGALKLHPDFDKLEADLETYEEQRIQLNAARKSEDEKIHVNLPEVPQLQELEAYLKENRAALIQEALGVQQYLEPLDKLELSRLTMMLDPRDRCLNIAYVTQLAKLGNFKKALHVYQKFVARYEGLLYIIEN